MENSCDERTENDFDSSYQIAVADSHAADIVVTLGDDRSHEILARIWARRIVPFVSVTCFYIGMALFAIGVAMIAIHKTIPQQSQSGSGSTPTTIELFLIVLQFIVTQLRLHFTGLQALFYVAAFLLLFLAALKLFRIKLSLGGHTTVTASKDHIVVNKNWFNIFSCDSLIPWHELSLVSIITTFARGFRKDTLCFTDTKGKNITVDASYLSDEQSRLSLIALIKRYAPLTLSSELEQLNFQLASTSYAEIWMDTLNQGGNRKRDGELVKGMSLSNERFVVLKKLGSGGQGTAYLATVQYLTDKVFNDSQNSDVELVVLKEFILPEFDNPALVGEIVARIQHEALLLKTLSHKQIVRVIDAFIEDFRGYLVIEHVDGTSLREHVMARGKLSEPDAISLGMQMCNILEYLHGHAPQVVHRDFTPDNLLLDEKGILKLIDFNLAKVSAGSALPVGKPAYMAPEQVKGRPEPASDFYSLGALMYFLVTGVDPEPLNVSDPMKANRNISLGLNDLIMRLTDQDKETRIGSAQDARKLFAMLGLRVSA